MIYVQNQIGAFRVIKANSINERGSGWKSFFNRLESEGPLVSGVAQTKMN
ncbi:hypothetical protein [uncultured Draconibacterium sp.]|nr:hypothetical protein [uncultured Draconibacterium sp.]